MALPARRNFRHNPYNYLLSEALNELGCDVAEFSFRATLPNCPDIIHLHWPQKFALGTRLRALWGSAKLVIQLALLRLRGARIVWTVHDVGAQDVLHPRIEHALLTAILRLAGGLIFLSRSSRDAAIKRFPQIESKRQALIGHPLYGKFYPRADDRAEARRRFGLPAKANVVSFLGDIKPYKRLEALIDAFETLNGSDTVLFVAGMFADDIAERNASYGAFIRKRLGGLEQNGRVVFLDRRLCNNEFSAAITASDIVALPYRVSWNSGMAILFLEHGARIAAADAPIFRELRNEVGGHWIALAEAGWTADFLKSALSSQQDSAALRSLEQFRARRDVGVIAAATLAFYESLLPSRKIAPAP